MMCSAKKTKRLPLTNRMLGFLWSHTHTCTLHHCVNILKSLLVLSQTLHLAHLPPATLATGLQWEQAVCPSGCWQGDISHSARLWLCSRTAQTQIRTHSPILQRRTQVFFLTEQILGSDLSNRKTSRCPGLEHCLYLLLLVLSGLTNSHQDVSIHSCLPFSI